jgi:peptidoglycan hydrolase CwlO-like protein
MKINTLRIFVVCFTFGFYSCNDLSQKMDEKLNELENKTKSLDSMVNKELDKVNSLDSIINMEGEKVKKLDSIIHNSTSRIDSLIYQKIENIKK